MPVLVLFIKQLDFDRFFNFLERLKLMVEGEGKGVVEIVLLVLGSFIKKDQGLKVRPRLTCLKVH